MSRDRKNESKLHLRVCPLISNCCKRLVIPSDTLSTLRDSVLIAVLVEADAAVLKLAHPPASRVLTGTLLGLPTLQLLVERMPAPSTVCNAAHSAATRPFVSAPELRYTAHRILVAEAACSVLW